MIKSLKIIGVLVAFLGVTGLSNIASAQTASAACVDNVYNYSLTAKTCVKYIQILANETYNMQSHLLGGDRNLVVDGKYGTNTKNAVANIQSHANISLKNSNGTQGPIQNLKVDGITGRHTWATICHWSALDSYTNNSSRNAWVYDAAGCSSAVSRYYGFGLSARAH